MGSQAHCSSLRLDDGPVPSKWRNMGSALQTVHASRVSKFTSSHVAHNIALLPVWKTGRRWLQGCAMAIPAVPPGPAWRRATSQVTRTGLSWNKT